jgi:hypothetical protein
MIRPTGYKAIGGKLVRYTFSRTETFHVDESDIEKATAIAAERDGNIQVGFWHSKYEPWLAMPVGGFLSLGERTDLCNRLQATENTKAEKIQYRGHSTCRLCGCLNGSASFSYNGYEWPEGLKHYVLEHGVALDPVFIRNVLTKS